MTTSEIAWGREQMVGRTARVPITCTDCGKERWITTKVVKEALREGRFTGTCRHCAREQAKIRWWA